MKKTFLSAFFGVVIATNFVSSTQAAIYADRVISYTPGTTANGSYATPSAALGAPTRLTATSTPGVVSPFNPPFLTTDIVSIGQGGQITLRLSNFIQTNTTGLQLGIFAHAGIIDTSYPNGVAGATLNSTTGTFSVQSATLQVSPDNINWVTVGTPTFGVPTNGFTDASGPYATSGTTPADFGQPYSGSLANFAGLSYAQMLTQLNGSGGGNWFDLSGTGLSQVGYVRLSVATATHLELDAVSVANGFVGTPTPEPSTFVLAGLGSLLLLLGRKRLRLATPKLAK